MQPAIIELKSVSDSLFKDFSYEEIVSYLRNSAQPSLDMSDKIFIESDTPTADLITEFNEMTVLGEVI